MLMRWVAIKDVRRTAREEHAGRGGGEGWQVLLDCSPTSYRVVATFLSTIRTQQLLPHNHWPLPQESAASALLIFQPLPPYSTTAAASNHTMYRS